MNPNVLKFTLTFLLLALVGGFIAYVVTKKPGGDSLADDPFAPQSSTYPQDAAQPKTSTLAAPTFEPLQVTAFPRELLDGRGSRVTLNERPEAISFPMPHVGAACFLKTR
ncbi:MAG: hypothetical protein AAGF10_04270, partial [Verrucomicrobiota bacterium]